MKNLAFVLLITFGASQAAEIRYEGDTNTLWIVGVIEPGDANVFETAVSSRPNDDKAITVSLASSGGDVIEAMKIGRLMHDRFIPAYEATHSLYGNCLSTFFSARKLEPVMRDVDSCGCHSSCFVIWAGSPFRIGGSVKDGGPDGIGIHRPRFDKAYFGGLSATEAEMEYERLTGKVMQYLSEMGVPDELAEKMFSISSKDVYLLSDSEIDLLESPPAIAEWLTSKCGEISKGDQSDYDSYMVLEFAGRADGKDYLSETQRRHSELLSEKIAEHLRCKMAAIKTEQLSRR